MDSILHITSGDCAGASLADAGLPGEVFVWHDVLYDGPREPGWPTREIMVSRAEFIRDITGGGLSKDLVLNTFEDQYRKLEETGDAEAIVLWFDACLFDQSMLCHILTCLHQLQRDNVELLVVDSFPGIEPYNGLGQMTPDQLASVYSARQPVSEEQFAFAAQVDAAFATRDLSIFNELASLNKAPIPWVPAAVARWLQEQPDPVTGLGRLETLALDAVRGGMTSPPAVFKAVAEEDTPPQYWGDTTLWATVNSLAEKGLVQIQGPTDRLPQWESDYSLADFLLTTHPHAGG